MGGHEDLQGPWFFTAEGSALNFLFPINGEDELGNSQLDFIFGTGWRLRFGVNFAFCDEEELSDCGEGDWKNGEGVPAIDAINTLAVVDCLTICLDGYPDLDGTWIAADIQPLVYIHKEVPSATLYYEDRYAPWKWKIFQMGTWLSWSCDQMDLTDCVKGKWMKFETISSPLATKVCPTASPTASPTSSATTSSPSTSPTSSPSTSPSKSPTSSPSSSSRKGKGKRRKRRKRRPRML